MIRNRECRDVTLEGNDLSFVYLRQWLLDRKSSFTALPRSQPYDTDEVQYIKSVRGTGPK
jgi:hypothetical protein